MKKNKALAPAMKKTMPLVLLMDLLQLPLSLVFTRFMNLFSAWIPSPEENLGIRFLVLLAGIILTGIGAGTVVAVLLVGRVIALFNHLFMERMVKQRE